MQAISGRTLVRSEFEAILKELSEIQQEHIRLRFNEPINKELTAKVVKVNRRLAYVTRILVAAGLLILAVFMLIHTTNLAAHYNSDAKTPRLESR